MTGIGGSVTEIAMALAGIALVALLVSQSKGAVDIIKATGTRPRSTFPLPMVCRVRSATKSLDAAGSGVFSFLNSLLSMAWIVSWRSKNAL